jgi:hypothetical protein
LIAISLARYGQAGEAGFIDLTYFRVPERGEGGRKLLCFSLRDGLHFISALPPPLESAFYGLTIDYSKLSLSVFVFGFAYNSKSR